MPAPLGRLAASVRRYWWAYLVGLFVIAAGVAAAVLLEARRVTLTLSAPVSCSLSAGRVVDVRLRGDGSEARLARAEDGGIEVDGERCGAATVRNVEAILVEATAGGQTLIVDLSNGPFGPGFADEGDGGSEIEISVDLRAGDDTVAIQGGEEIEQMAVTVAGVNLNATESSPDVDVTMRSVEALRIAGGGGDDRLTASPEGEAPAARDLVLWGGEGDDELTGGSGDDELVGGDGDDLLRGAPGQDDLAGGEGDDIADYGEATTRVEVVLAEGRATGEGESDSLAEIEGLIAGAGDDLLIGNDLDNELAGGEGDDVLIGGSGDDAVDGGPGEDTADYSFTRGGVSVDLAARVALDATGGSDALDDVERVVGGSGDDDLRGDRGGNVLLGGRGDDRLEGVGGADRLFGEEGEDALDGGRGGDALRGGRGHDELRGGRGADVLRAERGDDSLDGGRGRDVADYSGARREIEVDLSAGEAPADGSRGGDVLERIEDVLGGPRDDVIRGDAGANVLTGGRGDDRIQGRGGADTLHGERGDDLLRGGENDDRLRGGGGSDVLFGEAGVDAIDGGRGTDTTSYVTARGPVFVDLESGAAFADGEGDGDDLVRIENALGGSRSDRIVGDARTNVLSGGPGDDVLVGGSGNDVLRGAGGDDILQGGRGHDQLEGATGADRLAGEEGNDRLGGGLGVDVADYAAASVAVTVDLGAGTAEHGGSIDRLTDLEIVVGSHFDDRIVGDDGANTIRGLGGADVISGLGGDDRLVGGPGPDTIDGGAGDDVCEGGPARDTFVACETERGPQPPEALRAPAGSAPARTG